MQPTRRLRTSSLFRWAAVIAWMAFVFCLSAQPSLPRLYDRLDSLLSLAGHFIEYAVLALLLRWALHGHFPAGNGSGARHAAIWAFVMAVMFGLSDEIHQYFVPGRNMDPLDLLTDAIGAALALWVAGWIVRRRAGAFPANERGTADST